MAQHDLAPYADLGLAQPEGECLYGQRLVHARGEVDGPHAHIGNPVVTPGKLGTLGMAEPYFQKRTLMNAPTSRKPTRR